jgi:hypothetical protein
VPGVNRASGDDCEWSQTALGVGPEDVEPEAPEDAVPPVRTVWSSSPDASDAPHDWQKRLARSTSLLH